MRAVPRTRRRLTVLAQAMWKVASALARLTHRAAWRARVMPPGSGRQRVVRAGLRRLLDVSCRRGSHRLVEVVARVARSKGAVIFLPSIGWNVKLFQRPHHLARAFARSGYVAIFASTSIGDDVYGFEEIEPNLFLFCGPASRLRQMPNPMLWTLPYNFHEALDHPRPATVVYDWIDDLAVFTDHDARLLHRNHERAFVEADVVASVARTLHTQALARRTDAVCSRTRRAIGPIGASCSSGPITTAACTAPRSGAFPTWLGSGPARISRCPAICGSSTWRSSPSA